MIARLAALAAALLAIGTPARAGDDAALQRDVVTYDRFGDKLTGGPGNRAATDWIAGRLRRLGYRVSTPAFDRPTYAIRAATLTLDARTLQGFPLFPVFAPSSNVRGGLTAWDGRTADPALAGRIAFALLPDQRHSSAALSLKDVALDAAARAGAKAVVLVTRGPSGELIALNADAGTAPPPLPVLLVAGREATALQAAATRRAPAQVRIAVEQRHERPHNVLALRRAGPHWIILSTPISGWFAAAAERGSGVATFLSLAARMRSLAPCDSIALIATSGHETGYGGITALLDERRLPPPDATDLWVHIGAGLASWADPARKTVETQRYLLATAPVADAPAAAFAALDGYRTPLVMAPGKAIGESEPILAHGYDRVVANASAHLLHHSHADHADRTAGAIIAPVADAYAALIARFAAKDCRRER